MMFLRIVARSFNRRRPRIAVAVIAVLMGASMTSGLLTVSTGIEDKLAKEFRRFGSNILVIPRSDTIELGFPGISFGSVSEQRYIDESDLWKIKKIDEWSANVLGFAPMLYQVVQVEHEGNVQRAVLTGTYFDRAFPDLTKAGEIWSTGIKKIASYWNVEGNWIEDDDNGSVLAGVSVAEKLKLKLGDSIYVSYENPETKSTTTEQLSVAGTVSTGGSEDSQLFVPLSVAQRISGRLGKVHSVQVSALCVECPAELIGAEIEKKLPYTQAKTVKQLVRAEEMIMDQLGQMMLLITVVALVASGTTVTTTMMTTVMERRREIGLMKSIGAENSTIASIFLAEAVIVGVTGGFLGYGLGNVLAQHIAESVFSAPITPLLTILPVTVGISLSVAVLASTLPVRRAIRIDPAIVLRGE
ncbi:ABC transporter permease [Candidatus Bathyarchaeota archaeon]|nr:ABC transporter permease [Candidatus Bathyarchaeota archaeon]